jgi:hypothetical protein
MYLALVRIAEPDPSFHFDADPDPYFTVMRIWILLPKIMRIHEDPDPQHCLNHLYYRAS